MVQTRAVRTVGALSEGVVEDQNGALIRRESPEGAVELVAVMDRQDLVGSGWCIRLEQDDIGREVPRRASA